jgi:excisionase family DNA binding protein
VKEHQGKTYLTPKEVARRIGVAANTVYRWLLTGKLRARRLAGCRYLIEEADADAMLKVAEPAGGLKQSPHEVAMRALREAGLVK